MYLFIVVSALVFYTTDSDVFLKIVMFTVVLFYVLLKCNVGLHLFDVASLYAIASASE